MNRIKQLSHLQLDIMRVLWRRGEATVADVHSALMKRRGLATTTIATMLSRLEKSGVVGHRSEGRQFVYQPVVTEKEVRTSMVRDMVDRLFSGDSRALVGHLIQQSDIRPGDLDRVKGLLKREEDDA